MSWFLAHLVGDFLIQTDWMATRKRQSSGVCAIHALTYLLPFLALGYGWLILLLVGCEHFLQDRFGLARWFMRYTNHEIFATGALSPWSVVVVDQVLHLVWIAGTLAWLGPPCAVS
jgi:hypothetical protein